MEIELHSVYKCKIAFRKIYKGRTLKKNLEELNGRIFELQAGWICQGDEHYPGEFAMISIDRETSEIFVNYGIGWIASGDLEIIEEVEL